MTRLGCNAPVPYRSTRALAGYRPAPARLGRMGASAGDAAKGIGVSVASKAAGGAAGSAAVSAGLVTAGGVALGAVTLGVGLVVAFALGKLLTKNYLNVPAMNGAEDQDVAAYNQYLTIMGQAPGRAFGLAPMLAVFRGANHSGAFPSNNGVQCFHEGCSKYPGRADWVNGIVNDYGVHGNINFPDAYYRFAQDRNAADFGALAYNPHPTPGAPQVMSVSAAPYTPPAAPPGVTIPNAPPTTLPIVSSTLMKVPLMAMRGALKGLGQAGPAGVADAVNFIDNFLLPYNQQHNTWIVPHTSTEHQILYDVADAYLASKGIQTDPFIATPTVAAPPTAPVAPVAVPPNIANTMMPNYSPTPLPPGVAQPYFPAQPIAMPPPAMPPPQSGIPNFGTVTPVLDPSTGQYVNPTAPSSPFGMAATTGSPLADIPPWLLIGGAALLLAGTLFLGKKHQRARR
jgi:hypothetical protein